MAIPIPMDTTQERVTVRPIQEQDVPGYVAFLEKLDTETAFLMWKPGERKLNPVVLRERIRQQDRADGLRLVAEEDGEIVGFLVVRRRASKRIRHRADFVIGVLRRAWGRGIGTSMLETLEDWAQEQGVWRLELAVMAHNERAIQLYEKFGYAQEGVKRSAIVINGQAVDEIIMAKLLK